MADNGCASGDEVAELSNQAVDVPVAVGSEDRRHQHDFRPVIEPKPVKELKAPWLQDMEGKWHLMRAGRSVA